MFENKKILFVGAHPDDIDFGCGGTLHKLKDKNQIQVHVFSTSINVNGPKIIQDLHNSISEYGLCCILHDDNETMKFMQTEHLIKQALYDIKQSFKPDIVFSTSPKSLNVDHAVLGVSVSNVFQEQTVIFYEMVRGDQNHKPNLYIILNDKDVVTKFRAIDAYSTQKDRIYSDVTKIDAQLTFRGVQIGQNYAEAFEIGRIIY